MPHWNRRKRKFKPLAREKPAAPKIELVNKLEKVAQVSELSPDSEKNTDKSKKHGVRWYVLQISVYVSVFILTSLLGGRMLNNIPPQVSLCLNPLGFVCLSWLWSMDFDGLDVQMASIQYKY